MNLPLDKLQKSEERFAELEGLLADPAVIGDQSLYQKSAKEYADLTSLVTVFREYKAVSGQIREMDALLAEKHDPDFGLLAQEEKVLLAAKTAALANQLNGILNPPKAESDRAVIFEIRAGTGGQEASLFAADLYRMYTKYADQKKWEVEVMNSHESETGGFKEIIFSIKGKGVVDRLKWESGAHRVQRVPATEASGRIHTSAATVAVMPEPEEVDVVINPQDLKIDVYRSSGPGGQSVNTTDSAVRITHLPSGVIVTCQDERSQLKNRMKAMRVLRARLMDKIQQDRFEKETRDRRLKIGSGDRSEKIRTYNWPDRRVTDHRVGFTSHQLEAMMNGDLDELTTALMKADEEDQQ
ncbi:MAG: peptide chain release factor 1 [Candidatus Omnitrophica bacterium]|nr:peptide chain release factor 1 [Candidatus Omnitrophota bacterium]